MKRYYLAYGSNLNVEQMAWRCPDAKPLGVTELPNYRLMFKGSRTGSYLTIEREEGASVPVAVWSVSAEDEKRLDRYEGYPTFYYKKEIPLSMIKKGTTDRVIREAFVYIMHEDRPFGIPSPTYVETCKQGYKDFGLDARVLDEAVSYTRKEIWNEKLRD